MFWVAVVCDLLLLCSVVGWFELVIRRRCVDDPVGHRQYLVGLQGDVVRPDRVQRVGGGGVKAQRGDAAGQTSQGEVAACVCHHLVGGDVLAGDDVGDALACGGHKAAFDAGHVGFGDDFNIDAALPQPRQAGGGELGQAVPSRSTYTPWCECWVDG